MALAGLPGAMLALAGCATQTLPVNMEHAVELDGVPFFSQERYQCGPAALATVLVFSDVDVTPEELVPLVYVPERKGSFQAELKAATRDFGRLPYELDRTYATLLDEVARGNPVLVLQNLGFGWLPKWHYAVVIGYEPETDQLLLRSGTQERRAERSKQFLRSWRLADNWAMVTLQPGQLPATASAEAYLEMLARSERQINPVAMGQALAAGMQAWPRDANLIFAAGNYARLQGDVPEAAAFYRSALAIQPDHVGALNNYADLLYQQGCLVSAREQIMMAQGVADSGSALHAVLQTTAQEISAAIHATGAADTDRICSELAGLK